jgi:hypothetical protein
MEERERCYSFILSRTPHKISSILIILIFRFQKQLELMQKVCTELEPEQESDPEDVKRKRFETVLDLMQKVIKLYILRHCPQRHLVKDLRSFYYGQQDIFNPLSAADVYIRQILLFPKRLQSMSFILTPGWSSGLRSRLQNQRSRVLIPVVGRGFCDEQLHLLTSHGCLYYILLSI